MRIFLFLLLLSLPHIVLSFTEIPGNLRGIVINKHSIRPIRGARIKLIPFYQKNTTTMPTREYISGESGEFVLEDIKPGLYNIECSAFGYKTTRMVGIQIREGQTRLAYFKLESGLGAEIVEMYTYASLEAKGNRKIETGVGAREAIDDVLVTAYIITAKEIEDRGYVGLNELLLDVPEFEIQDRHSEYYNSVSSRGIYGNEKLLILVNGVRYSSMVGEKYAILENYNIQHAQRVEVILGPASALYGADAYMGVVNIITKDGNEEKCLSITNSYGLYNTTNNGFYIGEGNNRLNFSMSGGIYYSDEANLNELYPNDFEWYNNNYLTNGQVRISPSSSQTKTLPIKPFDMSRFSYFIEGRLQYKKWSLAILHNQEQHASSVSAQPEFSPYWRDVRHGTSLTGVNLEHHYIPKSGSKKWSLKTLLNGSFMFVTPNSKFVDAYSNYRNAYQLSSDLGIRLTETFQYKFNENHRLIAGLTAQHSVALSKTSDLPNRHEIVVPFDKIDPVEEDIYYLGTNHLNGDGKSLKIYQNLYYIRRVIASGFVEYHTKIQNKLLITLGARFDQFWDYNRYSKPETVHHYYSVNPRIGLVYKPINAFNIKFFYGEGYLQPSPQLKYNHFGTFFPVVNNKGQYSHIEGDIWRIPNEELLPEKVRTTEISAKFAKGDFVIAMNSYFNFIQNSTKIETNYDTPIFKGIPVVGTEKIVNTKEPIITYGSTLRLGYKMAWGTEGQIGFKLNSSYTYADGIIQKMDYIPYTAKHTVKTNILFWFHALTVNNSIIYRSMSYSNSLTDANGNTWQIGSPAYAIWNLSLRYRLLKKKKMKVALFFKVNNLLNSRYYHLTKGSSISLPLSPQDPIRFVGGVTMKLGI